MKLKKIFKKGYQSLSIFGAVIFFTYGGQKLANLENICIRDQNKFFEGLCYAQKVNSKIYSEINYFIGTVKLLNKGTKRAPRWASSFSLDRFKEYNSGFDFSYDAKKGINKGFFLLSRIDPDLKVPKVELWDLTQQSIIHTWQFNIEDIRSKIKINDTDWEVLRFLHPLLLEDGSIVTHIQPENDNTQLLKFNYCGNLTKIQADKLGYHHSIEIGDKNRLYVPIARVKEQSKFYENYKKFPANFRNEGIAILNTDLVLEKVIPLDEIFDSIGLLSYVNSRFSDFKNDPYHLNDVHPYRDKNGNLNLLLSMRHFGLISYNLDRKKVNWFSRGLTDFQHDITPFLGSKEIFTIFDNGDLKNSPLNKFKGNTIVKLDFSDIKSFNDRTAIFGKDPNLDLVKITRYDFGELANNLIPRSNTEGRGRFIDKSRIFIEETNHGRAFVYNLDTKNLEWSYFNKGKSGYSSFLGWSRHLDNIPEVFKKKNFCKD